MPGMISETCQGNQWPADILRSALIEQIGYERVRCEMMNQFVLGAPRLSCRPEAIERDVLTHWLRHAVPAGNA